MQLSGVQYLEVTNFYLSPLNSLNKGDKAMLKKKYLMGDTTR